MGSLKLDSDNNRKMKQTYVLILLLFMGITSVSFVKAQDPEFTQFYANPLYLNPAFAGSNNCPRVALNYRNQWPALSGSFVTTSASYDQHVNGLYGGLGLLVVQDNAGNGTLKTTRVSGMYAYAQQIGRKWFIRFGVEATYFQRSLDWNKLTFGDMIDPNRGFIYSTADLPQLNSISGIDISSGILATTDNFFIGFSAHHLTEPNESLLNNTGEAYIPMKFSGHAGYEIQLGGSGYQSTDASISPNVLYRYQGGFQQLNLGLYVKKGNIVGGVWYRDRDAFIALLGIETDRFQIGYSYDVTVSKLANASAGSHELSLMLKFDCKPPPRKYRTINCPSF